MAKRFEKFSEEDLSFVSKCVEAYFRDLPVALRTGFRRPNGERGKGSPHAVPPDMIEGLGPSPGLVFWKPVRGDPPRGINPTLPSPGAPPTFIALMRQWRWCSLRLSSRGTDVVFPPTPTHQYDACMYRYWVRWGGLAEQAKFVPFADNGDGRELICFDRSQLGPDDDSPVVALPKEPLCRMAFSYPRETVAALSRPVAASFRQLLTETCLDRVAVPNVDSAPPARVPVASSDWQPFDWEPLLVLEPGIRESGAAVADVEDLGEVERHVARIAAKIAILRRADPALMIPGAEYHRWEPEPVWLASERAAFEKSNEITLPEPYARFLMTVGNGGIVPHRWLYQAENSRPDFFAETGRWEDEDENHFQGPFPHRAAWLPTAPSNADPAMVEYDDPRQIRGTMLLCHFRGDSRMSRALLLVVNGPERGHIWIDDRYRKEGIYPLYRRGPWSFLAWYEQSLDHLLGNIDRLYEDLEHRSVGEYEAICDAAWRLEKGAPSSET